MLRKCANQALRWVSFQAAGGSISERRAQDATVVSVSYPPDRTRTGLASDLDATIQRLRGLPGVTVAGVAVGAMVDDLRTNSLMRVASRALLVERKFVSPEYFEATGITILDGRPLVGTDNDAVLVNESLAKRHWPVGTAIGQQIVLGSRPHTVIGVVRDTFDYALDAPPVPMLYSLLNDSVPPFRINYVIRGTESNLPSAATLARHITVVNPDAIVIDVTPLTTRLASSVNNRTFATLVLVFFAAAGMGVCTAGLFALISFVVTVRTHELGIRIALGASPFTIRTLVAKEASTAAILGVISGLLTAWWLSQTLSGMVYGIQARDWPTLLLAAALMVSIIGLTATWAAGRATRLPPWEALRVDG